MEKTLREEISFRRAMLIDSYNEWLKGNIKSQEYNQLAKEFTDSVLSLLSQRIKAIEFTKQQIDDCYRRTKFPMPNVVEREIIKMVIAAVLKELE